MARPARAMTRSGSNCRPMRSTPTSRSSRRGATGSFKSRTDLIQYAELNQIPVPKDKRGEAPFSVDANLLHTSSEGKVLEDPSEEAPDYVYQRTVRRWMRPTRRREITIGFEKGDPSRSTARRLSPATLLASAQRSWPRQRHRPARSGREPLCRHEVARRLRDAGRHHPARPPTAPWNRSRSTAARRI